MIRVVELGPFGCRIERGTLKSLDEIPEGYKAKGIENHPDSVIVYVLPTTKEAFWRTKGEASLFITTLYSFLF